LNITNSETVASADDSGHLLTLGESDGVSPLSRGGNGVHGNGNGGKLEVEQEQAHEVDVGSEVQVGVKAGSCRCSNGIGLRVYSVASVGTVTEVSSVTELDETVVNVAP
jgi:hypothetical protein